MLELVIEGHDGAAKTPVALGLQERLQQVGYHGRVYAPFQLANQTVPEKEIYSYWGTRTEEVIKILQRVLTEIKTEAVTDNLNFIIYDRHWMTVLREISGTPYQQYWTDFLPTFFMEAPPEKTQSCKRFSSACPWTASLDKITEEYQAYLRIAANYHQYILGHYLVNKNDQPLRPIIEEIATTVLEVLRT